MARRARLFRLQPEQFQCKVKRKRQLDSIQLQSGHGAVRRRQRTCQRQRTGTMQHFARAEHISATHRIHGECNARVHAVERVSEFLLLWEQFCWVRTLPKRLHHGRSSGYSIPLTTFNLRL